MLDLHTHILPQVDDGSQSVRQSMTMLRREAKQGISQVVFTPHFYADRESPDDFLKRRNKAFGQLEEAIAGQHRKIPQRYLGAEVAYFSGIGRAEALDSLCIGNTQAVLIEMPFCRWNSAMVGELEFIRRNRGLQPILAHVDRYIRYQPLGTVRELCDLGFWIQANTSFFSRWQSAWMAFRMLKKGQIHFLGSDCHNTKSRPPNMETALWAIVTKLGEGALDHLDEMERWLLEGE